MIDAQKMMIKSFMSHSNLRLYVPDYGTVKWADYLEYYLQCVIVDLPLLIRMRSQDYA